ncbi:GNAT family N-acetyltransferase [Fodinicurvata sp. EGI_FJ10296]|uniref:GNAT family N-acetyltransferase n=1 Tax=Fodinicurvata sp. EGI_FJ10296 TaxID=3231908 RepID=UPI003456EE78
MIELKTPFRPATEADAQQLADLVNFAGEGLPLYIWESMAEKDQDPWDVGRSRQAAKAREGEIIVMDFGAGAVAGLTGYAIGAQPTPVGEDLPPLFRPMVELENRALDSWYINVLACYPEYRGRGIGSQLLHLAERIAQDQGMRRMSLIVASNNSGARRLYERNDYSETARLPCVKEGWKSDADDWVLLTKPL